MDVAVLPSTMIPDAVESYCLTCKQMRVFSSEFYRDREERIRQGGHLVNSDRLQPAKDHWPGRWKREAKLATGIYTFAGLCASCRISTLSVFILIRPEEQWVQKIGQFPEPWRKPVPTAIQKALGTDFVLYQRARALISEGFGMGACAYLRRLLEDQIDPLLDMLAELEEARGSTPERIEEIARIKGGRDFAQKARTVVAVLPASLSYSGGNPLITLHSGYSAGMHGWSEEDCVAVAELSIQTLGHLIVTLSEHPQKHREYVERLKAIDKKRAELEPPSTQD